MQPSMGQASIERPAFDGIEQLIAIGGQPDELAFVLLDGGRAQVLVGMVGSGASNPGTSDLVRGRVLVDAKTRVRIPSHRFQA